MKYINIESWNRRDHYNYFKAMDYPQFNITANVDITIFYKYIKENNLPVFISILYAVTRTANTIKEFRYRIRNDKVVEHEIISPSFTVLSKEEVFGFCTTNYSSKFNDFKNACLRDIENTKNKVSLEEEGRDDLLFISSIPWVAFSSITHPIHLKPVESIPRITWGKIFEEANTYKLPISIQINHALVDGLHIGMYFNHLQEIFNSPIEYLK